MSKSRKAGDVSPETVASILNDLIAGVKLVSIGFAHNVSTTLVSRIRTQHPLFFERKQGRRKAQD